MIDEVKKNEDSLRKYFVKLQTELFQSHQEALKDLDKKHKYIEKDMRKWQKIVGQAIGLLGNISDSKWKYSKAQSLNQFGSFINILKRYR